MTTNREEDPYCSFKDDRERRTALVSLHRRDIRIAKFKHWRVVALRAFALLYQLAETVARFIS
jgi:hypothetical protein